MNRGLKSGTIRTLLKDKVDNWISSITDETLQHKLKKDTIVSGGCITSYLLGESPNDFDLYFRTYDTALHVAQYYVSKFNADVGNLKHRAAKSVNPTVREEKITNSKGEEENRIIIYMKSSGVAGEQQDEYAYFEQQPEAATDKFIASIAINVNDHPTEVIEEIKDDLKPQKQKYRPVFLSDNAITLSDKIQLIIRFYGDPDEIHKNYDFIHTHNYYTRNNDLLVLNPKALEAILSRTLIYSGSLYPIASVFRTRKFIERGWRISAGQMLKMIFQINELDLRDPKVLRDQLIGVDMAYMSQLINAIKENDYKIDATYIAKLVDEIFQ